MRGLTLNSLTVVLGIVLAAVAGQPARALFVYDVTLTSDDGQVGGSGTFTVDQPSGTAANVVDLQMSGLAFGIAYTLTETNLLSASYDTVAGALAAGSSFLFSDIVFVHLGRSIQSIGFNLSGPDTWHCSALFGGCPADTDSLVFARAVSQAPVPAPPALAVMLMGLAAFGWLQRRRNR